VVNDREGVGVSRPLRIDGEIRGPGLKNQKRLFKSCNKAVLLVLTSPKGCGVGLKLGAERNKMIEIPPSIEEG
jgi:hypothetical protein